MTLFLPTWAVVVIAAALFLNAVLANVLVGSPRPPRTIGGAIFDTAVAGFVIASIVLFWDW